MSFPLSEITKPDYSPVIMVQIDKTRAHKLFINSGYPGVYFFNIDAIYSYIDSSLLSDISSYDYQSIGSIIFGDTIGNSVNTLNEIKIIESSFFTSGKNIYINCPEHKRPSLFNISLGVAIGFRYGGGNSAYFNNLFYDDRAISIPSISKAKNDLYFGRSIFDGGTIELVSNEEFDGILEDEEYEGNNIRCFLGFEGYNFPEDFKKIISGYIEEIVRGADKVSFLEKDQRKRLSLSLPNRLLNITTWPYLDENNYNAPIPFIYGSCKNIPVICLNEKESPTPVNYKFLICDSLFHEITTANVIPVVSDVAKTSRSVQYDTTNNIAYFEIPSSASEYNPGDDIYITGPASAKIQGYKDINDINIEYALDIIKDLLLNYNNKQFTDSFFNIAHWDDSSDLKIGIFINESKEMNAIIDEIIASSRITFIMEDDGRYAGRIFNKDSAILQYLYKEDILEPFNLISTTSKIISNTKIGYNKDWKNNKYSYFSDSSNLVTSLNNYQISNTKKIDTLLINAADAETLSDYLLEMFSTPEKIVEIKTNLLTIEREIGDLIQIEIARPQSVNTKAYYKAEIIKINKDITGGKNTLTCRLIEKIYKTAFTDGCEWGNEYWGNSFWCKNYYRRDLTA